MHRIPITPVSRRALVAALATALVLAALALAVGAARATGNAAPQAADGGGQVAARWRKPEPIDVATRDVAARWRRAELA